MRPDLEADTMANDLVDKTLWQAGDRNFIKRRISYIWSSELVYVHNWHNQSYSSNFINRWGMETTN